MSDGARIADLERAHDEILQRHSSQMRDYLAEHGGDLAHHHVHPGGFSLPLRPIFLTRGQLARLNDDVRVLWSALLRVFFETYAGDVRRIGEQLRLDEAVIDTLERYFAPEQHVDELFGRSDAFACDGGFAHDGRIVFIEQNITSGPGGLPATGALTDFFANAPTLSRLRERTPLHGLSPMDAYEELFRSPGFAGATVGYIDALDFDGSLWDDDGLRFLAVLADRGVELFNLTGREMVVRADGLYADGRRIDRVYRGGAAVGMWHRHDELAPIYEACRRGLIHMTTSLFETVFFDKVLLAHLSDPRLAPTLSRAEAATIARILPWTRLLRDDTTDYGGQTVSIPRFCRDHREILVLKRGNGFASNAVHIGTETDDRSWDAAVDKGLAEGNWIVQRLVDPSRIRLPFLIDGRVEHAKVTTMICPFVVRGTVRAIAARTSIPGGGMILVGAGEAGSLAGLRTAFAVG